MTLVPAIEGATAVVELCGGCGYPTLGPDLCAFCQAVDVLAPDQPAA